MAKRREAVGLSEDWREREDGFQLVLEALISAYRDEGVERLAAFIEIGLEFSALGLANGATAIAQAVGHRIIETPLADLASIRLTDPELLPELVDRLSGHHGNGESRGQFLLLCADIYRRAGKVELALAAYSGAVALFAQLGLRSAYALACQRLGATYGDLGNLDRAEEHTREAEAVFGDLADQRGLVEVRLNLSQYALIRKDAPGATLLLESITEPVRQLRDGHLSAALLHQQALLDIHQGKAGGARMKLMKALQNCRRRHDVGLEVVVLQNLAKLTRETRGSHAAVHWDTEALRLAHDMGDLDREQSLARSLAIDLVDLGEFTEAGELFERAVDLNIERDVPLEAARSRADLGAALLSQAFELSTRDGSGRGRRARSRALEAATIKLTEAFEELDRLGDYEWAARAARNLDIAWTAQGRAEFGADYLERRARQPDVALSAYSGALLRIAAFLSLSATRDGVQAIDLLAEAATLSHTEPGERAWQLVADAVRISDSFGDHECALAVYDLALETLSGLPDRADYANVLNDSALLAAELDRTEDARRRLLDVEAYAAQSENRVLGALAKTNLGEIALREGRHSEGRDYLIAASELAAAVGDHEGASRNWASIANSLLSDAAQVSSAKESAARASELARRSGSSDAIARALSASASVAYSEGDYLGAHDLWVEASGQRPAKGAATYLGFALDALAQAGDWKRFSRALDRFTRRAQRTKTQLEFAEQLWDSALTWLRSGSPRRAAKPLAYSILLAADGYAAREKSPFAADRIASDNAAFVSTTKTLIAVRVLAELDDIPSRAREDVLRHVANQLTKVVGSSDAEMLISQVAEVSKWVDEQRA